MRTIKSLTSLTWAALLIVLSMPVVSTQERKSPEDSAARIRQLMQEISLHYKAQAPIEEQPENVKLLVFKVFEMFRNKPDSAAGIALFRGFYECVDEAIGGNLDPRLQPYALLVMLISCDHKLKENFIVSILPLLESEDDPGLTKFAAHEIVDHYFSGDSSGGIDRWITQHLKKGRLLPKVFIDKMFEGDPERALVKLLSIYEALEGKLSDRGYLFLFMHSVNYAMKIDFGRRGGEDENKDDGPHRELRRARQFAWETSRRTLVQAWQACPQWYVRRYLAHYVRKEPRLLLTPELAKLMVEENHPMIKPIIKELQESRWLPSPETP